jgi:hypothetical protein
MPSMLRNIVAELRRPDEDERPITASTVRRWMRATDLEVKGAVSELFARDDAVRRIAPPLPETEVMEWLLAYLIECLRMDPQGNWVSGRWGAAHSLMTWFLGLWAARWDRSFLERIRTALADLYLAGEPDLRDAIEHRILEHLFEERSIRRFFDLWKDHPQLATAHEEASHWYRLGGRTPTAVRSQRPGA